MPDKHVEFITANDIARLSGINKSRVNFWMSKGLLAPTGTLGRAKYFDKDYALARVAELIKERA